MSCWCRSHYKRPQRGCYRCEVCFNDATSNMTNVTRVVHCKKEPFDVYIGRPGPWGNPFKIGDGMSRGMAVARFRKHLAHRMQDEPGLRERIKKELKGRVLGCWCDPELCHGHVLAEIADG